MSAPFSPAEIQDWKPKKIAEACYVDPVLFNRFFLPHLFPKPIPWFHRGILAILTRQTDFLDRYGEVDRIIENFVVRDREGQVVRRIFHRTPSGTLQMVLGKYTLIKLPRGFSKTTLCGIGYPLRNIAYQEHPLMAYVSETGEHSQMQLGNVKREIESNHRYITVFGVQKPTQRDSERWAQNFIETTTGCAIAAKGRGGQIRGLNHRGNRPSLILVDDVEDKESVKTEEQRIKTREWAYGDLMPALPEMNPDATILALGTLLHPDALLQVWERDPLWTVVNIGVVDAAGELTWPEMMNRQKLETKKQSYAMAGQLSVYYMEFHNQIRNTEDAKFRQEFFKYGALPVGEEVHHAIYIDPAISDKKGSDSTVIVVVAMTAKGQIYVREIWGKVGASPREQIDNYFRLARKFKCDKHGVEATAYQAALVHLIREEMFRKKWYFEVQAVKHKAKKEERIEGILQPRYAAGYITHEQRFPELEVQLLDWPNASHDDYPDALAGAIALLDPYAAHAAGDTDLAEDEYEPLEKALGGDWRGA